MDVQMWFMILHVCGFNKPTNKKKTTWQLPHAACLAVNKRTFSSEYAYYK